MNGWESQGRSWNSGIRRHKVVENYMKGKCMERAVGGCVREQKGRQIITKNKGEGKAEA